MVELELPTTYGTNWGAKKSLDKMQSSDTHSPDTKLQCKESADTDRAKNGAKLLANISAFINATLSSHSCCFFFLLKLR